MMTTENYDAIIIGAGQAGGPLSTALARAGWKTALIEREHVGGTCINRGCTPTKTMVASARVAYLARRAADYGVHTGPVTVNMAEVRQRKRDIVTSFRNGSQRRIEGGGVELLFGEASFTGPKTLEVRLLEGGTRQLTADKIFINTGGRPEIPPVEGLNQIPFLDSTSIMELDTLPEHLIMLGGGYIGLEFGQMFHRFGSRVTIVQRGKQLLAREDPDVAEEMANLLREDGLEIMLEAETRRIGQTGEGGVELSVQTSAGEHRVRGSHLLVSAGRLPNTETLNLAAAGVETQRGFIKVNERLETNVPGVYALGDVKGGPAFTHISYDDFRIIRTNLLAGGDATITDRPVPYTLFTDPQLGRIGLNETEAKAKGLNYRVAKIPMNYVARALELDEPRGFMKALVDPDTQQILGFAVIGIEGGEIMAMLQMAMMGKLPYPLLRDAIFAHPTLAEGLNTLFSTLDT
jgi:pyruvate/2-oxoglutarate dehydrogenase complex dihydrolipoamide dehydrogenase (E3) component